MQAPQQPDYIVVSIDNAYATALSRNVGFIQIVCSEYELVDTAFNVLRHEYTRTPPPFWRDQNAYSNCNYPGVEEDRALYIELVEQLITMMRNNVQLAAERLAGGRPVVGVALQDLTLFVQLG